MGWVEEVVLYGIIICIMFISLVLYNLQSSQAVLCHSLKMVKRRSLYLVTTNQIIAFTDR